MSGGTTGAESLRGFCLAGSGNSSKACGLGAPGEKRAIGNEIAGVMRRQNLSDLSRQQEALYVSVMLKTQAI